MNKAYRQSLLPLLPLLLQVAQLRAAEDGSAVPTPAEPPAAAPAPPPSAPGNTAPIARSGTQDHELLEASRLLAARGKMPDCITELLRNRIRSLLHKGANPLTTTPEGNSAQLYLMADGDFYRQLLDDKLVGALPKESPADDSLASLINYIRKKLRQWDSDLPEPARQELLAAAVTPLAPRAWELLDELMSRPLSGPVQKNAMANTLRFLQLADGADFDKRMAELPYWEHAEHFIESTPGALLEILRDLRCTIPSDKLRQAAARLRTMLPASVDDQIDCNAAAPLALILDMLMNQEGDKAWPDIEPYLSSHDPQMVCAARVMQLRHLGLPEPEADRLAPYREQLSGVHAEQLEELITCCRIHRAVTRDEPALMQAGDLEKAPGILHNLGAHAHARIIEKALTLGPLTDERWQNLRQQYIYERSDSPKLRAAQFILDHPELFATDHD